MNATDEVIRRFEEAAIAYGLARSRLKTALEADRVNMTDEPLTPLEQAMSNSPLPWLAGGCALFDAKGEPLCNLGNDLPEPEASALAGHIALCVNVCGHLSTEGMAILKSIRKGMGVEP